MWWYTRCDKCKDRLRMYVAEEDIGRQVKAFCTRSGCKGVATFTKIGHPEKSGEVLIPGEKTDRPLDFPADEREAMEIVKKVLERVVNRDPDFRRAKYFLQSIMRNMILSFATYADDVGENEVPSTPAPKVNEKGEVDIGDLSKEDLDMLKDLKIKF